MSKKSDTPTDETPLDTIEQPEEVQEELAPDEVRIAEGTEVERIVKIKIPRGKQYREKHRKLLSTFGELESISNQAQNANGGTPLKSIIEVIERLFGQKDFEDVMVPFALSMEDADGKEYLDMLLPMEKFTAYMQASSYIVSGGNTDQVRAALKK